MTKCQARRHPHLGACVFVEIPDKPQPKALPPPEAPAETVKVRPTGSELVEMRKAPVSQVAGQKPGSRDEAKELLARAVSEIALQGPTLRRLRQLLRAEDNRVASGAWAEVLSFLREQKNDGGNSKPVNISLNNFIARPAETAIKVN
jgi:hypothetical protein